MATKRRGRDEGSIRRRMDGLWEGSISLGTDTYTNKRMRRSVYARTKNEVYKKLQELRDKIDSGAPDPGKMTVGEFLSKNFLEIVKPDVRPNTYVQYEYVVRMYLAPVLGNILLSKVNALHVQSLMTGLAEKKPLSKDAGTRRGDVPSPRLRQLCFAVLRRAFRTAMTLGLIGRNPCEGVKQPSIPNNHRELWTRDQVQHFLESTKNDRYYAYYVLSLMSGARQGELLGLTWENVDLDAGTIRIVGTLIESKGHIVGVHPPKTPSALRTITIPPTAVDALKRHRLRTFQEGKAHFPGVFPGKYRHQKHYSNWTSKAELTRTFQKAVRKAGLPMIRMHDLRHLHATMAIATGGDIRTVSARLGHSKPSVTLDIYAHAFAGNDRKVSASVDELVFGPLSVSKDAPPDELDFWTEAKK